MAGVALWYVRYADNAVYQLLCTKLVVSLKVNPVDLCRIICDGWPIWF